MSVQFDSVFYPCIMHLLDFGKAQVILESKFKDGKSQVVSLEESECSDDLAGFLGLPKFTSITFKRDGKEMRLYLFIKLPPTNDYQKYMVDQFNAFVKEPLLYNAVINDMKKLSSQSLFPKCYYSSPNEMLVLEDFSKLGYKTRNSIESLDIEHSYAVLKAIAEFHVLSLKWEAENDIKIDERIPWIAEETLHPFEENHPGYKYLLVGQRIFNKICQKYKSFSDNLRNKLVTSFTETEYSDIIRPSKKFINVLSHLDLWRNNIMYKYEEKEVRAALIDFQLARYCNPAVDVLFFIYCNVTKPDVLALIRLYHKEFTAKAKLLKLKEDIMDFPTFVQIVNESRVAVLIRAFLNSHTVLIRPEIFREILPNEDKHKEFIEIDRDEIVLNEMDNNLAFRERILSIVEELAIAITGDQLEI